MPAALPSRPDDPSLGETVVRWGRPLAELPPRKGVLVGFPQDEGVRRNGGRTGAASAPHAIRGALYRLVAHDGRTGVPVELIDAGDVEVTADLERSQEDLALVVAEILKAGAVPVVLGGGHETALGVYCGHVLAGQPAGVINVDAHLDVRPTLAGLGHSGSPFRQAMEHPLLPLPGAGYVCLGAQPASVSLGHLRFVVERGGRVVWRDEAAGRLVEHFQTSAAAMERAGRRVHLSLDADAAAAGEVPGVSAPSPLGLPAAEVACCAHAAGGHPAVSSLELVEINPALDPDGRSVRWAAQVIWHFLAGLAGRR